MRRGPGRPPFAESAPFRGTIDADLTPRAAPSSPSSAAWRARDEKSPGSRGEVVASTSERTIATLAGRQHGVVTRAQLRELGFRDSAIDRRVAAGRLHRLHRGVYAVGHRVLSPHGRSMAAVLACGRGAALSHASAAALWELRRAAPGDPTSRCRRPAAALVARSESIASRAHSGGGHDQGRHPRDDPAGTILDLAAILQAAHLENVLNRMEFLRLADYPALAALGPSPSRPPRSPQAPRDARPLRRGSEPRPQRPRDPLPADLQGPRAPGAGRQHHGRRQGGRLPLQGPTVDRRGRLLALPPHPQGLRGRPREDVLTTRAGYRTLRFTDRQLTDAPRSVAAAIGATLRS